VLFRLPTTGALYLNIGRQRGYIPNMTIPQPEPSPKPEVPDPEAEAQEEAAKKERADGTDLGEQREPA